VGQTHDTTCEKTPVQVSVGIGQTGELCAVSSGVCTRAGYAAMRDAVRLYVREVICIRRPGMFSLWRATGSSYIS
jgi:hypothetical protein